MATTNNTNNVINANATANATAIVNEMLEKALTKQMKATDKAGTMKAGTMKTEISKAKKTLKATLVAIRDIANMELETLPERMIEGSTVDILANEIARAEILKANAKITEAQKILKALNIDYKKPITRDIANAARKKITELCPVIVKDGESLKLAKLAKVPFSKLEVFKTEYFYIAETSWEEVITEIFITNKGEAPTQKIEVSEFTTTPNPAQGRKGEGPIFAEVNAKMLQAKKETADAIFERWENIDTTSKRIRGEKATEANSELLKESAKYKAHKV